MTLADGTSGCNFLVKEVRCEGAVGRRLADFGIYAGARVKIWGLAPLGDPMIVLVNDCQVAVRRADAQKILVV